jgi:hypothetical protein
MARRTSHIAALLLLLCCSCLLGLGVPSPSLSSSSAVSSGSIGQASFGSGLLLLVAAQPGPAADDEFDAFDLADEGDNANADASTTAHNDAAADIAAASPPAAAAAAASSSLDLDDDAADLLADDDEFVGATPAPAAATAGKKSPREKKAAQAAAARQAADAASAAEPTIGNVSASPGMFFQQPGVLEFVGLGLIVAFLANWVLGSRANRLRAERVAAALALVLEEQFAQVGDTSAKADLPPHERLIKESDSRYVLFSSGRRGAVESTLLSIDMQPRQDLVSMVLGLVDLAVTRDTITIDLPLTDPNISSLTTAAAGASATAGSGVAPFVFALLRKKLAKKLVKGSEDLEDLIATPSKSPALTKSMDSTGWTVLSDVGAEVEEAMLSTATSSSGGGGGSVSVARILAAGSLGENLLLSVHVSDQMTFPFAVTKRGVRVRFQLPSLSSPSSWREGEGTEVDALQSLVRLSLALADRAAEVRLTPAGRARADARRKRAAEAAAKASAADKAEALRAKKEEQRRREAEIVAANPSSEQAREILRKKEAKEAKLAKKAASKHVKVVR